MAFFAFHFPAISLVTFCFSVPFSLAEEKVRLGAENNAIREFVALLRANQIARIISDFWKNGIKLETSAFHSRTEYELK